jgi:NAD(P)-dependent dehydrogenase (short-subunit alcohol dehydrogenase family)
MTLNGRLAVVTGAGRGIGAEIARGLAGAGAEVVLVSRGRTELEAVAASISREGRVAHVITADVSEASDVDALATQVTAIGTANILVNAAGVFGPIVPIVDSDPEEWFSTMRVNLLGPYLTCRAFVPAMVASGTGCVLNLSSAAALHSPGPLNSAYATSKVALNQFTRHLAAEIAGTGVTANVLHPGDVKTEMWGVIRDQVRDAGAEAQRNFGAWVDWVERTGGDPAHKAVDLVLRVAAAGSEGPHGEFLWIDDPLQPVIDSWTVDDALPSYASD